MRKNFFRDDDGAFAVIAGVLLPVLIGAGALATEIGLWAFRHQQMQGGADAAALAGVIAQIGGLSPSIDALAVTAQTGFQNGQNSVTVTVSTPPTSGVYKGKLNHVEVNVRQPYQPAIAKIFSSAQVTVSSRSVARPKLDSAGCLLALNETASNALNFGGNSAVTLSQCSAHAASNSSSAVYANGSTQVTTKGVSTPGLIVGAEGRITAETLSPGSLKVPDPYASVSYPSYDAKTAKPFPKSGGTINPGVYTQTVDAPITLNPGIYFVDANTFVVNGSGSLTGSGVTLVLVDLASGSGGKSGGNGSTQNMISGSSPVNLTAPADGPTAGIVVFADRTLNRTISFNGSPSQTWTGAIYMPSVKFTFSGGAAGTGCTQIIADTISFSGRADLALNCVGIGVKPISLQVAELVE